MTSPGGWKDVRAHWLMHLRAAIDDVDTVARDMMRMPAERELGPAKHREIYDAAAGKLAYLLGHVPPDPDEHGSDAHLRAGAIIQIADGWSAQRAAEVARMERDEEAAQ